MIHIVIWVIGVSAMAVGILGLLQVALTIVCLIPMAIGDFIKWLTVKKTKRDENGIPYL